MARVVRAELRSEVLVELVHGLLLGRGEVLPLVIQLLLHLSRSARHELLLLLRLLLQRIVSSLKLKVMLNLVMTFKSLKLTLTLMLMLMLMLVCCIMIRWKLTRTCLQY